MFDQINTLRINADSKFESLDAMMPTLATVEQLKHDMNTVKPKIETELKRAEKQLFVTQRDFKNSKDKINQAIESVEKCLDTHNQTLLKHDARLGLLSERIEQSLLKSDLLKFQQHIDLIPTRKEFTEKTEE